MRHWTRIRLSLYTLIPELCGVALRDVDTIVPRHTPHGSASCAAFGASDVVGTVLLFGPDTRLTATEWAG